MGTLTDFFLADDAQLATIFSGWVRVADEPVRVERPHPFTGQMQSVNDWPTTTTIGADPPAEIVDLSSVPHAFFKRVDHVKIACLYVLMTDVDITSAINELCRPALVNPVNEDTGLSQIPDALTAALAALADDSVSSVASSWAATEEMEGDGFEVEDCAEVVEALRGLAVQRSAPQEMYLLWGI